MKALQALLFLNVSFQDIMLNHLMLDTLDPETQRELELNTAPITDIPSNTELLTFFGIKVKGFGIAAAHPDTDDVHYHTTVIIPSGN